MRNYETKIYQLYKRFTKQTNQFIESERETERPCVKGQKKNWSWLPKQERERESRKIRSGMVYFHLWRENMMIGQKKTGKLKVDWWIETHLLCNLQVPFVSICRNIIARIAIRCENRLLSEAS